MDPLTKEHFARAATDAKFRAFLMSEYQLTEDDLPPLVGDAGGSPTSAPEPSPDFSDVEGEASGPAKPGSRLGNAVRRLGGPFAPIGAAANLADRLAPGTTDAAVSGDMAKSIFRGATLGLGDEAVNTLRAGVAARNEPFGAAFDRYQAQSDSARRAFSREHPALDMAGQMGGAFLTAPLALPRALGAVPNTASTGAKLLGMGKRIGAVGGVGAVTGAVAGGGDPAEGQSRGEGALQGGIFGGALGTGAGVLGEVGTATGQLLRRITGKSTPGEIMSRYAAEAGTTADDALARATAQQAQGKAPTTADALGRTGLRLGQDVGGSSPRAADILSEFGEARTSPSVVGGEIRRDVAAATGRPGRPTILTQRFIDKERQKLAGKVYPLLQRDTRPINDPEVMRALDTDLGRQAYAAAAKMARADATAAGVERSAATPFTRIFNDDGVLVKAPNIATLDWIKRGMDELLNVGTVVKPGQGASLSKTERQAIGRVRTFLMNRLDQLGAQNPTLRAYSKVRKEQESAFAVVDWMDTGFRRFKQATIADGQVTDDLVRLGEEAASRNIPTALLRDAYRQAALDAFTTRLRSGSLRKVEQSGAIESLRALGLQPAEINDLLGRVRTTQERQQVGQTFQRLLGGGEDPVVGNKGAAFGDAVTGNVAGGARNIFKASARRFSGITPTTAPVVADALRQPADRGIAAMRAAGADEFARRNRVDTEALVAFLLGQQAGGSE